MPWLWTNAILRQHSVARPVALITAQFPSIYNLSVFVNWADIRCIKNQNKRLKDPEIAQTFLLEMGSQTTRSRAVITWHFTEIHRLLIFLARRSCISGLNVSGVRLYMCVCVFLCYKKKKLYSIGVDFNYIFLELHGEHLCPRVLGCGKLIIK